nr:phage tail length tape measure family protein [Azospirillum aestuarii]
MIQQGPQIVDVFLLAGKEAAVAAARIALMATPVLAIGAAFAVAAYGMKRFFDDVREAERVTRLTGNAAGITASQFVSMTDAVGASRGISNAAARDIATAYIGTGKIGGQVLTDLTAFTKDFAVATSQDVAKASEDLAGMFSSPAKAAEEAAQKWGMFSDAQVQTIRNYEAQGQLERAQQALLEGLKPRIDGAAEKVAWYTKLWDGLGRVISNAADAAGRYGAGPQTHAERTTALQKDIDLWTARVAADPNGTTVVDGARVRDADMLQQAKDALARELRDQRDRDAKAASDRKAAEFNRLQTQAMNLARSVDPAITATQDLRNAEIMLNDAVTAGAMSLQDKTRVLNLYKTQLEQAAEPAKAFALEMERQARVTEASVGRARDFEQQRQEILKKRGAMPGEALTQTETDQINDGLIRKYAAQAAERHRSMQEAIQDAQRLGAATASLSQPTIIAAQAEAEFFRVLRETSDYKKAKQAEDDALTKGMIEFNAQVDTSIATGQLAVASAQRLADAQARGGDIAMARARSENVLAEQLARGVDPVKALTLAALDYQESLADLSAQQRAWNRDIAEQTDAARRLAQAEAESGAAVAEANIQNKVRAQILKEGVDLDSARAQAIEAGTRALEAQNAAARVNSSIRQGNQDLALVRAEYDMLGMSNAERERSVAIMRAQLEVQNSGDWAQVPQETRDAWIAQAGAVAEYRSRVADATEASRDFANVIGKGFEDAVLAGGQLSDILKGLQSDIERIFLRATVTKPLENWLTGTMTKVLAPAPANDNLVQPVNDNDPGGYRSLFEGLTGGRTGVIGSQGNPMWVRFASAGGAALDLNSMATQATSGPVPVAVKDAGDLEGVIQTASAKYGVDANTIKALIQQESTWTPTAVNPRSGAAGLMQIMPANWSAYGVTNPFDPAQNVDAGTRIFREHLDRAGGDLERALSTFGGFITKSSDGYVASVKANRAAYDQAATSTVTLAGAQTQAAAAASVFTSEQRKVIDAALGSQKATVEATDKQDALTNGLGHFRESLEAETKSRDQAVRATQQLTQAQQTAAAGMVGGTQAALGGIMSLLGGITGAGTVSVGGSVISAGGPQGISAALGSVWNGISGGSFGDTSLSGVKSWLNSTAWGGNVASKTAPVAKAGNGMLAGGEGAQTGMGTAPATPAVTWGNVVGGGLTAVGGALQMSRAQNAGQSIGGAAQMAGGVMMLIPGMQVAGGLVALGGTLLSAFSDGNSRGDPYSVTNLSMKGGRFTRDSFDADNGGDPAKWNSAVEQVATKLNGLMDTYGLVAGKLTNVAVGERNATPEQAMLQALRSMKSDNADIAWVLANAVGDDLDAAVKAIDFASKWRDTITLWNSGMDSIVAATQQGTAAANAFGKTVLAFLDGAAATYDVAALTAKAGSKTGNAALDKLLAGLPGYATGTPSAKAGWAVVGEDGPELVKLAGGERIWNARESARMVAGLGQGRDTELVHVRPDELAWMHKTLGGGRINPVTGLPMFLEGETGGSSDNGSGGVGGMGGNSDGYGGHTDRDGGFTASENSGGFGGFISTISSAISDVGCAVANALGLDAKEAGVLGGMVGITGTVAIGGIRGFAEAMGKGLASVTGPGEAPAVAGPGDPGLSPTGGDFTAAEAVLTKLLDAIKADPTGTVATGVMGGLEAGATGYTVAQLAGGSSDAYLAGVRGQGGEAKVAALAEDLDAAVQSIAEAGVAIPDVLRQALEKTNAYATSLGITPATEKRETAARLLNEKLGEQGLSTGRYGEVMGVVQSLADGTFSAVGKDFQALADDMVKSMAAMSAAGMQVPAALAAAEKRMLALVAAKARIDAEIAGVTDTSTDYQKQVAQLTGYWSMASTDLVKAMQAVGYEGAVLSAKLGEGVVTATVAAHQ